MNKERRKALGDLQVQLQELRGKVSDIHNEIETLRDEEQEYFDCMPESFQSGEKGDLSQAAIDAMDEVISNLDNIDTEFDEAENGLNTATE